jgi:hypothetical protein
MAIFTIMTIKGFITICRSSVINLINISKKEEKTPKVGPGLYLLSIVSLVILGYGYYKSLNIRTGNIFSVVPVIIIIIIGTYGLFKSVLPVIINLIMKNKNILFNGDNIIAINNINYRLNKSYKTYAIISIIITTTISTLGAAVAFKSVQENARLQRNVYTVSIASSDKNEINKENIDNIIKETNKIKYEVNPKLLVLENPNSRYIDDKQHVIMKYSDFENTLKVNGNKKELQKYNKDLVKGNNVIHVNIPANDRAILLYIGNRKLDFSNRQIPNRKVKGIAIKSPSLATKQQNNEDKKAFEGKLVISKDNLVISNNWYKVSFFKNSPYSEINFVKTSKTYQFFLSNAIRYRNKNFSVLSKKSKRELKKSLDGKKIDLTFHEKFTFPDRTISSQITFTFWNDRPVIKFSGQIKQDSQAENTRITGSLNSWWFKKIEAGKVMHLYSTGPVPRKNGLLVDLDGNIEAGWRKKYKYFSLSDGNNAFGIITPSLENASLYVSKKKHGYISGSKIKMDGNIYKTDHYIYIGSEKELDMWAEKIYTSQHKKYL